MPRGTKSPRRDARSATTAPPPPPRCFVCLGTEDPMAPYPCVNHHPDLRIHGTCFMKILLRSSMICANDGVLQYQIRCGYCNACHGAAVTLPRLGMYDAVALSFARHYDRVLPGILTFIILFLSVLALSPLVLAIATPSLAYLLFYDLPTNGSAHSVFHWLAVGASCTMFEALSLIAFAAWSHVTTQDSHPSLSRGVVQFAAKVITSAFSAWIMLGDAWGLTLAYRIVIGTVMCVLVCGFSIFCSWSDKFPEFRTGTLPPGSVITSHFINIRVE